MLKGEKQRKEKIYSRFVEQELSLTSCAYVVLQSCAKNKLLIKIYKHQWKKKNKVVKVSYLLALIAQRKSQFHAGSKS